MLQQKYFKKYGIKIVLFANVPFKDARIAKNSKRKRFRVGRKKKLSSKVLSKEDLIKIIQNCDEDIIPRI